MARPNGRQHTQDRSRADTKVEQGGDTVRGQRAATVWPNVARLITASGMVPMAPAVRAWSAAAGVITSLVRSTAPAATARPPSHAYPRCSTHTNGSRHGAIGPPPNQAIEGQAPGEDQQPPGPMRARERASRRPSTPQQQPGRRDRDGSSRHWADAAPWRRSHDAVKLGVTRPPMIAIKTTTTPIPSRNPRSPVAASPRTSRWVSPCWRAPGPRRTPATTRLRRLRPRYNLAPDHRGEKDQKETIDDCGRPNADRRAEEHGNAPRQPERRERRQTARLVSVSRPVQFGTAVNRNPAIAAAA